MIIVNLDVELAKKKMRSGELAERIGITPANLSVLKTGKAKAIRFTTLDAICKELDCQPGDILEYRPDERKLKSLKQFSHFSSDHASSFFIFSSTMRPGLHWLARYHRLWRYMFLRLSAHSGNLYFSIYRLLQY